MFSLELPIDLQAALAPRLEQASQRELLAAAGEISARYRAREPGTLLLRSEEEALAYALARMPATYGAVSQAAAWALETAGPALGEGPFSLLDAGAGTGAAAWAMADRLPLSSVCCLEYSPSMRALGSALMQESGNAALREACWQQADLTAAPRLEQAGLVTAAYVLNELPAEQALAAAEALWQAAGRFLLLVEPGTPDGFGLLRQVRERLLARGAFLAAPCPQDGPCPLPEGDWCHFACRVQRTRLHKLAKGGDAPFEDEKFAFLAFTRQPPAPRPARILRRPQMEKGRVGLRLCTRAGLAGRTVSKREGPRYKLARKAAWGGGFPEEE